MDSKLEDEDDLNSFMTLIYKCKRCLIELSTRKELLEHVKNSHNHLVADKNIRCDISEDENANKKRGAGTLQTLNSSLLQKSSYLKPAFADGTIIKKRKILEGVGDHALESGGVTEQSTSRVVAVAENHMTPIQVEVVDSSTSFKCPDCPKKYKQKQSLETHCRKMHQKEILICPKCRVRSNGDEDHQIHILSHYKDTFKCIMCDFTNAQWHTLKVHMETHNKPDKHECDSCNLTFASSFALCNHKRFAHLGGFHLCDECGFKAPSKYVLVQHRMEMHGNQYVCQICNHHCDNQIDMEEHIKARHQNIYICKSCSTTQSNAVAITYNSKQDLLAHMTIMHPNEKCFFCEKCNYVAKLRHHLKKHMLVHTGERPHKCTVEGCEFSTKDHKNLKQHMVVKHRKPGELVCRQCRFVTTNQNEWDVHKAMNHMKIYKCNQCDYTSPHSATIRRHRLSKHVSSDKMRYPCPQCSYRTNLKECLQKHILTHAIKDSQFNCVLCDQSFFDRQSMAHHLAEEHASKPVFLCEECPYMTQTERSLARHTATHESRQVKPFKCDQCNYAGRTSILLKSHKTNKHKSQPFKTNLSDNVSTISLQPSSSTNLVPIAPHNVYSELRTVHGLLHPEQ